MKGISNILPSFARVGLCIICALCITSNVHAQERKANVNVKDVSVKELLKAIEAGSTYTFAYVDTDIDLAKKVTVSATNKDIEAIIKEVLPGVNVEFKDQKFLLSNKPVADKPVEQKVAQPAAQRVVSGKVVDKEGQPIIGAMVIEKGTQNGASTDIDGNYSLKVKGAPTLEVSLIGYNTVTSALTENQTKADFILEEEAIKLDDVVVIGYGVQNKRDVTTSVSSIKAEDFANTPTTDFRESMAAKMPGVQVLNLGGQPDGNVTVRVRGIQSATSGNDPLYVIDGIPCDSRAFANLDGNDIESLEVLKDASAAAIYGSRGSCGVIIVTTKRGSGEKPVISYDGQFSVSDVSKKIDMLDAYEFATMFRESRNGSYIFSEPTGSISDPSAGRPEVYHRIDPLINAYLEDKTGTLTNTDWQDEIFRTALSHKHSLSVSARTKSFNYYIGANYLYREGTVIGSDFERYGIRANLDGKKGNLKYGISFSPSYSKTNYVDTDSQYGGDGVIASALMAPPIFPAYNSDGSYNWGMNGFLKKNSWNTQTNEVLNPVALALEVDDVREKLNMVGNVYASYEFIKGLEYKLTMGGDYYSYIRNYYRPSCIPLKGVKYYDEPSAPTAANYANSYFHWTISNQISFNRKFGDHSINAVAVYEAEKQSIQTSAIKGTGIAGDDKVRTTKGKTLSIDDTYNNKYAYTFASWLVRAQYSYKGRYMISASIRGDGSSRFAPDTRWGYFPAASIGWRISDENFMRNAKWLNDMKLRVSVGQTGNAQIGNSEYLALYGTTTNDMGNGVINSVYPSQIANNKLGWEKNTQVNAGFDANLWNGLLGINADFYYSKTTNMLFDVPVSSVSGLTTSNMNIGSMQNKGVELTLTSHKNFGEFSLGLNANWSLNRNKVLHLGDEDAPIIKESSYAGGYYITKVGEPVGCYYLLVQDGIFHNQEELDSYPHFETTTVGDFRFVDADGDGVLDKNKDRVIVGNYMPDFYYGFGVQLGWRGFDFAANFQGVYGNEILNLERRYLLNMEASSNMMKESLKRFPYGNLNRATRKSSGNNGACTSTFHLEDGSYLRLQNISLGYTMPDKWFHRTSISKMRIYIQANNLFTLTHYTGYNPEVNKRSSDALRPGEDYCSYPLSRTFSVGINFNL